MNHPLTLATPVKIVEVFLNSCDRRYTAPTFSVAVQPMSLPPFPNRNSKFLQDYTIFGRKVARLSERGLDPFDQVTVRFLVYRVGVPPCLAVRVRIDNTWVRFDEVQIDP